MKPFSLGVVGAMPNAGASAECGDRNTLVE